ncbi:MAG TPA: undecaprenyldiphospho-muramoylpentapeptide beta-N-acetylglucosaminyltransferase [Chromatiaceae bacterium]|nr:undecaprenyldiphospho-muramoylpentapeptide beta-N-acetylglucosaminyltransferase [Chromatiaceae bacterium]
MGTRVMIMAGGTGGHVYPALAVARLLRARGADVSWMGAPRGFEARLIPGEGFAFFSVSVSGLRGKGLRRRLSAPFMLVGAIWQAAAVVRKARPAVVLGMGGFVTGPGGVASRLLGRPLVIHEQNAIPGMTNRLLSRIANQVLEATPGSFGDGTKALAVGNPVRDEIAALPEPATRFAARDAAVRVLVLGGSLGAQALNETVPAGLARLLDTSNTLGLAVRHQAGRGKRPTAEAAYREAGVDAEVHEFIDDMAAAYGWADLVICRAGALTVAELAAAGVAALLVPYPHAVDDHQTANARYLGDAGAALLLPQAGMTAESLAGRLGEMLADGRDGLLRMALAARALAKPDAAAAVADACEALAR